MKYDNWKLVFVEQRSEGFDVWQDPFTPLRLPKLFNLRSDPFEEADHIGIGYDRWRLDRVFLLVPAQQYVGKFLATFQEFPPSQKYTGPHSYQPGAVTDFRPIMKKLTVLPRKRTSP